MQVKKDSVQNAILKAATEEFLKYGFKKSSMRRMAENAGTRMSNFYNYFKNKDELFSYIVKDQYNLMQNTIRPLAQSDSRFTLHNITDVKVLTQELWELPGFLKPLLTVKTVLLLACADGTRYEHVRNEFIQDFVIIINKISNRVPNKFPLELSVTQLLDNIVSMVRTDPNRPDIKEVAYMQICTFISGIFIITY